MHDERFATLVMDELLDDAGVDRAAGLLSTNRIAGHIVDHYARAEAQQRRAAQRHVDEEVGYSFGLLAHLAQPGDARGRIARGLPARPPKVDGTYMGLSPGGQALRTNLELETTPNAIRDAQQAHLRAVQEAFDRIRGGAARLSAGQRRQVQELLSSGSVFARVPGRRRPPGAGAGAVQVLALSRQGYRVGPDGRTIVPVIRPLRVGPNATVDTLLNRGLFEFRRFDDFD